MHRVTSKRENGVASDILGVAIAVVLTLAICKQFRGLQFVSVIKYILIDSIRSARTAFRFQPTARAARSSADGGLHEADQCLREESEAVN